MRGNTLLGVILVALGVSSVEAQQTPDTGLAVVDRIVAVVGATPITSSRLQEEINVVRQQGGTVPTDSADLEKFKREIIDRIIEQELLVQQALKDTTVSVSEQELQSAVEGGLREIRNQFPSELDYARELRKAGFDSPEDYRQIGRAHV